MYIEREAGGFYKLKKKKKFVARDTIDLKIS